MKLKKGTGFWGVFCVATGTMISSGLFVLPAIVFPKVGPAIFVAYFLSALLMIPAIFSKSSPGKSPIFHARKCSFAPTVSSAFRS